MTSEPQEALLRIVPWASSDITPDLTRLTVPHDELPVQMHGAVKATGRSLVSTGTVGADVIRLAAGSGFAPHTHPGHHVLVVIGGVGTITYGGKVYRTEAGQIYLVEGSVPHAVGAISDHLILAVGAPHMPVDSAGRMDLVPYTEVLAPDGDLECLLCGVSARIPARLHNFDCTHCPCARCVGAA